LKPARRSASSLSSLCRSAASQPSPTSSSWRRARGATAATLLARAGRSVVVIDKAVFPRDKCCGDGLTTLALRELEQLGLQPSMVPELEDRSMRLVASPSGREVCLPLPSDGIFAATTPGASSTLRSSTCRSLPGPTVLQGHRWTAFASADVGRVDVDGIGTIEARYVIAADGMWSPTRKALGVGETGYLGEWHAFRQYARNVTGPRAER
jgi:2-polyprenyl-6-methoxyphenol hydroxylase-like FAD-dependent oxidoreductase